MAVTAVSFASIFIRLCTAPPLAIAFYRLFFATIILLPITIRLKLNELKSLSRRDVATMFLIGLFLSIHFAFWITSLEFTSVASSVALVTTHPLFVCFGGWLLLREKVTPPLLAGIILSIFGCVLIAYGDYGIGGDTLIGDLYALIGAAAAAAYFIGGRSLRQRVDTLPYAATVYASCTLILALLCILTGTPFYPYSARDFLLFLALAVVPMIIGHTTLNWALKHLPASAVSASVLGEPAGSTLMAALLLREIPNSITLLGVAVTLSGIYLVSRGIT